MCSGLISKKKNSSPTDLQTLHGENDTSTWTDPYGYELIIRAAKLAGDFLGVVRRRGTEPLSNNASHMTWKASLKVQGADPGWPDSDARHPYTRLAILVKEGLRALLAKPGFVVMPAVWDGLSAKLSAAAGFETRLLHPFATAP